MFILFYETIENKSIGKMQIVLHLLFIFTHELIDFCTAVILMR